MLESKEGEEMDLTKYQVFLKTVSAAALRRPPSS